MANKKRIFYCKECGIEIERSYGGLCQPCYQYFKRNNYEVFEKPAYGTVGFVTDKNSKQYGMCICAICGRAYTKLQQHIYYAHDLLKNEYCDMCGIDHKARLTTDTYNKKMSDYAYKYDMDKQVMKAGKDTRFQNGHKHNYERSYQTKKRLTEIGKKTIIKNGRRKKEQV